MVSSSLVLNVAIFHMADSADKSARSPHYVKDKDQLEKMLEKIQHRFNDSET